MKPKNHMKLEFPGVPENVEFARVAVACFASQIGEFTLEDLDDVKLVVSEAVSNAIIHGYGPDPGMVRISGTIYEKSLEIIVEDDGKGIEDVDEARKPTFTTNPDRMGMGLTIIEALTDSLELYSTPGCGTKVVMWKSPVTVEREISENRGLTN